jgi:hypothetical protein
MNNKDKIPTGNANGRKRIFDVTVNVLAQGGPIAADVLLLVATDPCAENCDRVRAAKAFLDITCKVKKDDVDPQETAPEQAQVEGREDDAPARLEDHAPALAASASDPRTGGEKDDEANDAARADREAPVREDGDLEEHLVRRERRAAEAPVSSAKGGAAATASAHGTPNSETAGADQREDERLVSGGPQMSPGDLQKDWRKKRGLSKRDEQNMICKALQIMAGAGGRRR